MRLSQRQFECSDHRLGWNGATRGVRLSCVLLLVLGAAACGKYDGGSTSSSGSVTVQSQGTAELIRTEDVAAFESTVYPIVRASCAGGCHDSGSGPRGAPFLFAHPDAASALRVINDWGFVNFEDPEGSVLVRRPARDFHECGSSCAQIGDDMWAAIETWSNLVEDVGGPAVAVGGEGIVTDEVPYASGVEIELGERHTDNLMAFYDFKEGQGEWAYDRSGVQPVAPLHLSGGYTWMSSWGIELDEGYGEAESGNAAKLFRAIADPGVGTEQYSVEAWIENSNTTQEDAWIVGYGLSSGRRNFTLEQQLYTYEFRNTSTAPGNEQNGTPPLTTYDVDQDAQETLQHVVMTYDRVNGRRIYVDSHFTDDEDPLPGGRLWNWFRYGAELTIGAANGGTSRFWRGKIRMLAIYKQALTPAQIRKNFLAGVGKRLRLSFPLERWTGNQTFVEFSVTELDDFSYLFCQPTFVGPNLTGMRVKNMRIQINPSETERPSAQGQAFSSLDTRLNGTSYQVSRTCSIIPQANGPRDDTFRLVFEDLGDYTDESIEPVVYDYTLPDTVLDLPPETGVRDFARVHATMQELTGVDPTIDRFVDPDPVDNPPIQVMFEDMKEQLPATTDARSFASAHQVAVTRLAFEYCVEMVDRPNLRTAVFGSEFDAGNPSFFQSGVAAAFADTVLAGLMNTRLAEHMLGARVLTDQPQIDTVIGELDVLQQELVADCPDCDVNRTLGIAKGLCTAVLASAAVNVH